jgi:hypothetical protein
MYGSSVLHMLVTTEKSAHILTQQKKELSGAAVQPLDLLAKLSGLISLSLC